MTTDRQADDPMQSVEVTESTTMGPTRYHYGRDTTTGAKVLFATRKSGETDQLVVSDAEATYRHLTHPEAPIEPDEQVQYEDQLTVADVWQQMIEVESGIDETIDGPREADEAEQTTAFDHAVGSAQRVEELLSQRAETQQTATATWEADAPAPTITPAHEATIEPAQIEL
ncbi:hypothetical protein ACIG63_45730 [Streptomyces antimycoticus]|uniref:hypothetical protein n=1 Tax=Streptomyces antimycoticus TaxID=68175 RepID=UPI0037D0C865